VPLALHYSCCTVDQVAALESKPAHHAACYVFESGCVTSHRQQCARLAAISHSPQASSTGCRQNITSRCYFAIVYSLLHIASLSCATKSLCRERDTADDALDILLNTAGCLLCICVCCIAAAQACASCARLGMQRRRLGAGGGVISVTVELLHCSASSGCFRVQASTPCCFLCVWKWLCHFWSAAVRLSGRHIPFSTSI
jgi:hypothetical protein